jgi:tetratricopeptide (TPR) repeat protein
VRRRGADAAAAAALALLVALAYGNALDAGFVLDGRTIVLEDPRLRGASAEHLRLVLGRDYWWPSFVSGLYRPVTTLSYLANYTILGNGSRPAGYHVINLALHWANAVLVYLVARGLLGDRAAGLWIAALFAAHPIATEAVTYVVGRADLLATFFVLGALLLHVRASYASGWRRALALAGLALAAALGVLSKESAVALVPLLVWYDLTLGDRTARRLPAVVTGWLVAAAPILAVWAVRARLYAGLPPVLAPFVDNPLLRADFWTARATAVGVLAREFWLLVWPRWLSCDYSYDQIPLVSWRLDGTSDRAAIAGALLLLAALTTVIRRRRSALAFFVGFFFVTLLPTANLLRLIGSIMAERFLYLPSAAFAACVVLTVRGGCRRRPVAAVLLGALVVACAVRTAARNRDWHDDLRLWSSAVAAAPGSFKTHQGVAYAHYLARRFDLAIPAAERALAILEARRLAPADEPSGVALELGMAYWARGETVAERGPGALPPGDPDARWYERAALALGRAAQLDREENEANRRREVAHGRAASDVPDVGNWKIYHYLGLVSLRLGRRPEASAAFAYVLHLRPGDGSAYRQFARASLVSERPEEAAVALLQALALDAGDQEAQRQLLEVYGRVDPDGCALTMRDGRAQLDLGCPRVRQDLCDALAGLEESFTGARQVVRAAAFAQAARAHACPEPSRPRRRRSP